MCLSISSSHCAHSRCPQLGSSTGDVPTLIRKHVANTGQLRRRLYHNPISFVRDWAEGLDARIGDKMIGKSERSIKESRLIRLLVNHEIQLDYSGGSFTHVDFRTRVRSSRSLRVSSLSGRFTNYNSKLKRDDTYPQTSVKLLSSFKPSFIPILNRSIPTFTFFAHPSMPPTSKISSPISIDGL